MGLIPGQMIEIKNGCKQVIKIIPAEELSKGARKQVQVECDFCGAKRVMECKSYYRNIDKHNGKYACRNCCNHNPALIEERNKKMVQTNLDKRGVPYTMQDPSVQEKSKATNLIKYGVENWIQNPDNLQYLKECMFKKYGVYNIMELEEFSKKIGETKYMHNSQKVSTQQLEIYNIINDHFESDECTLNKNEGSCSLDISLIVNGISVNIEVDGYYWHCTTRDKKLQDRRRDEVNKSKGYKILRIVFDHKLPSEEEILQAINELVNSDKKFKRIWSPDITKEQIEHFNNL